MANHFVRGLAVACLFACAAPAFATEAFTRQTGKPCGACHLDPAGGGGLIAEGLAFRASIEGATPAAHVGRGFYAVRTVAGFLHLLAAMLWLGTLLYVHLTMKPTSAARGLPRAQVWIGRSSMIVAVVTGLVLTYLRVPSIEVLVSSRFGILLLIKVGLFLLMLALAILAHRVINPILVEATERAMAVGASGEREFTPEELDPFDGRDGRRAYIAYKGVIYDVTRGGSWLDGMHMGMHRAGQDLTRDLALAPHNDERVREMPVVGTLVPSRPPKPLTLPERIFYVATYLNFGLALAIVLVVALWRWL
jgi:predicted heme/steroid binding protein/uncharacterized membrane protein